MYKINAYLSPYLREAYTILCGPEELGEHRGKKALIRRALYGGKCAGRDYWLHLRSCMKCLGFSPCKAANPDVWMQASKREDNADYWEYILLYYVDDCLCISTHPEKIVREETRKYFIMKEASIGPPDIYLGGKVSKVELETGEICWSFSSSQYVQEEACRNVRKYLKDRYNTKMIQVQDRQYFMPKKAGVALLNHYCPEIDITPELENVDAVYYQSLIGILQWMVELGRINICVKVSMVSSCLALLLEGHLKQLFHIHNAVRLKTRLDGMASGRSSSLVTSNLKKN